MENTQFIETTAKAIPNWDNDGWLEIKGATTIEKYVQLRDEFNKRETPYIFFAFDEKKYEEGKERLKKNGWLNEDEKLYNLGAGGFTTKRGYLKMTQEHKELKEKIQKQCNPQEVYWYEYNNHESFISWDGDLGAIEKVIEYFGEETAKRIKRKRAMYDIESIIKDLK